MSGWTLHYFAGDLQKYGCSCCSNPTARWRTAHFRYEWMAKFANWWLNNGPVLGIQVTVGGWEGMFDTYITQGKAP